MSKLAEVEVLDRMTDWLAIEVAYRAGVLSLRNIAEAHGISEGAIRKRAKRDEWERDLKPQIKRRAEILVRKEVAYQEAVRTGACVLLPEEEEVVEAAAQLQARVIASQRGLTDRHVNLASSLLAELEGLTDLREDFEQLGELLYAPDEKGVDKLNEIYRKVISLPGRIDSYKKLGDNLKTIVQLQRQAVGLSDNSNGEADKPLEVAPMNDMEVARRMAFLLTRGTREQP